jgi:hypothetical protein
VAAGDGMIHIFFYNAGRNDHFFRFSILLIGGTEFIESEHELSDFLSKMGFQELDVPFQISSWHCHSQILLGQRAANFQLIKIPTDEVARPPFRQCLDSRSCRGNSLCAYRTTFQSLQSPSSALQDRKGHMLANSSGRLGFEKILCMNNKLSLSGRWEKRDEFCKNIVAVVLGIKNPALWKRLDSVKSQWTSWQKSGAAGERGCSETIYPNCDPVTHCE